MRFEFKVVAQVERTQGKFATKDELSDQIQEWLEGANEGNLEGDNGGEYEVTDWSVDAE